MTNDNWKEESKLIQDTSAFDTLKYLGEMSEEEAEYYKNL